MNERNRLRTCLPGIWCLVFLLIIGWAAPGGVAAEENMELQQIQKAIKASNAKWTAGENEISVMPTDVQVGLLGLLPGKDDSVFASNAKVIDENSTTKALPAKFDWRSYKGKNYVTSVKRQRCGDCWAFSAVATLESRLMIDGHPALDLSEQLLVSDCYNNGDCAAD